MAKKALSMFFVVFGPILFLGMIGEDDLRVMVFNETPPLWVSAGGSLVGFLMAVVGAWMRRR